jgi:hypothetical protein
MIEAILFSWNLQEFLHGGNDREQIPYLSSIITIQNGLEDLAVRNNCMKMLKRKESLW